MTNFEHMRERLLRQAHLAEQPKQLIWKFRGPPYITSAEFKSDAGLREQELANLKRVKNLIREEEDKFADIIKTHMTKWREDFESRTGRKPGLLDAWLSGSP